MKREFDPCSFCGGEVVLELVRHHYHWEGRIYVFEDVPAGVCRQCGERYFDAPVVKTMEHAVLKKTKPKHTLRVPVFSYKEVAA